MSRAPVRQDYVVRVRYQNELPPPQCPPKLLNVPDDTNKLADASFLSELMRRHPLNVDVNNDIGMPLDLTQIPGVLDRDDESGIYPQEPQAKLDPKDRALLREPAGEGAAKTTSSVAFLRRTEYISTETSKLKGNLESKATLLRQRQKSDKVDPAAQLRTVEATFEAASSSDLSTIKHPTKKHLKAVEAWPVVPDSKMFDLMYLSVKMVGSASLSTHKTPFAPESLNTALFKQTSVEDEEWMSFYSADEETAKELKKRVDSPADALPEEDESKVYRFKRVQDYDVQLTVHDSLFDEIAINFDEEKNVANYIPLLGRTSLKRRRVVKHRRDLVNEHSVANIDLSLREITAKESIARDNQRSQYDPVTYQVTEIEEDEEEQNGSAEKPDEDAMDEDEE
ncbi:RNA polymerase II-associated protein 1 [Trichomonascus vanleenenianus]|uniref:RNA polymerase II-associated protein 1 n=1 Tax=Trichomonascus vanleenenianus TaxID=2268995 RepID=UPI003ECB3EE1